MSNVIVERHVLQEKKNFVKIPQRKSKTSGLRNCCRLFPVSCFPSKHHTTSRKAATRKNVGTNLSKGPNVRTLASRSARGSVERCIRRSQGDGTLRRRSRGLLLSRRLSASRTIVSSRGHHRATQNFEQTSRKQTCARKPCNARQAHVRAKIMRRKKPGSTEQKR